MPFHKTDFPGLFVFEPVIFEDNRGYFFESFNENVFADHGINLHFVQDNQSSSAYGVVRGFHYQLNPYAQAKLVRVLEGEIRDVVIDMRKNSPRYSHAFSIILSSANKKQLLVPHGFAHGFVVLSARAEVFYKCDQFYNKACEAGIRHDDPALQVDWGIPKDKMIVSAKDLALPLMADAVNNFEFKPA